MRPFVEEAGEGFPAREHIVHRLGDRGMTKSLARSRASRLRARRPGRRSSPARAGQPAFERKPYSRSMSKSASDALTASEGDGEKASPSCHCRVSRMSRQLEELRRGMAPASRLDDRLGMRLAARQERSAPCRRARSWYARRARQTLSSCRGRQAMDYMLTRWEAFTRFLDDGRICLTNNAAERALRGWLWAGSHGCLPDRSAEQSAPLSCTRSSRPPSSTISIHKRGSQTFSLVWPTRRRRSSPTCSHGTGSPNPPPKSRVARLRRRVTIDHAGGEPIGDPKPLFDFAQCQNAAIRRQRPPSNLTTTGLPEADDRPGSGSIELFIGGCGSIENRVGRLRQPDSMQNQPFKPHSPTCRA